MARHKTAGKTGAAIPTPAAGEPQFVPADAPTTVCVWCGKAVSEDEAFMLRVGARLCPTCAEQAGRIAAEQRRDK
jgi:predicted nucleic acid-binding Zn ribbon protein